MIQLSNTTASGLPMMGGKSLTFSELYAASQDFTVEPTVVDGKLILKYYTDPISNKGEYVFYKV